MKNKFNLKRKGTSALLMLMSLTAILVSNGCGSSNNTPTPGAPGSVPPPGYVGGVGTIPPGGFAPGSPCAYNNQPNGGAYFNNQCMSQQALLCRMFNGVTGIFTQNGCMPSSVPLTPQCNPGDMLTLQQAYGSLIYMCQVSNCGSGNPFYSNGNTCFRSIVW